QEGEHRQGQPREGRGDDAAAQPRALPVRPQHRGRRRGLAARQRGRVLAARPDRPGPGREPPARELRGQGVRFRRRPLDRGRRQRRGRARARADGRALRALRLPRRGRLPEPRAVRDALRLRRPRGEEVSHEERPRSDALVFFGATGDLAYKKIFPALQATAKKGRLDFPVIGVAKSGWNRDQLVERAKASVTEYGGLDAQAFATFSQQLHYVDGDYNDPATFAALKKELEGRSRPTHYLAIPPSMFPTVVQRLAEAGCAHSARVVVEKPFGRDLESAKALNQTLHQAFPEENIFRIDHYLGKEAVQNI